MEGTEKVEGTEVVEGTEMVEGTERVGGVEKLLMVWWSCGEMVVELSGWEVAWEGVGNKS